MKLTANVAPHLVLAAQQVADQEGCSVASVIRMSVQQYCRPRLLARRAGQSPELAS